MAADNTAQRQAVALAAIAAAGQLVDAIYTLEKLADERAKFVNPFVDSDFAGVTGLTQCTAAMIGTLFDFVLDPTQAQNNGLVKWYLDVANGGRNIQTLNQVRPGA